MSAANSMRGPKTEHDFIIEINALKRKLDVYRRMVDDLCSEIHEIIDLETKRDRIVHARREYHKYGFTNKTDS